MFGLFKASPFSDPQFGQLVRSKGLWRGSIALPGHAPVPLLLAGNRQAPAPAALDTARQLPLAWPAWRADIEAALYEHYEPYRDAEPSAAQSPLLAITTPDQIWPHTMLQYVAVSPLSGGLTVEFGYTVAWDEEHTLGARFQQGRLLELNGSVLPP
jgi:hypothetical protein